MQYKIDSSSTVRRFGPRGSRRLARSLACDSGPWDRYTANPRVQFASSRRSGFSLTELMVVMVIMGILATTVALAMGGFGDAARKTKAITEIATYVNAIDSFYAYQGRYPTNDEGLAILTAKNKLTPSGYIKKITKDPWGRPYEYRAPQKTGDTFEIVSYGADGKEGGTDVNADISSNSLEND